MKAVYELLAPIPELGGESGDALLVEPGHPDTPVLIVRDFDASFLPLASSYRSALTLCEGPDLAAEAEASRLRLV